MPQTPIFKLVINPEYKDEHNLCQTHEEQLRNMTFALTQLGEAKGWGGNPRWDLLFEAGFNALVNEKK